MLKDAAKTQQNKLTKKRRRAFCAALLMEGIMIKRQTNQTSYYIKNYLVTIKRIKNDINGNPRWAATITDIKAAKTAAASCGAWAYDYIFNCYFSYDADAAKHILEYHINNTLKTK